ncbi:hypothetical protein SAY86_004670 [Trapa natans]|uniref:TF-B3 domain-containing protein n=1 Tax=Trapa natans TaxID=22666 RepID=A0AAN7M843_TRANT|nr:hypothetical protein SAY86_004670 [Trapa natans]
MDLKSTKGFPNFVEEDYPEANRGPYNGGFTYGNNNHRPQMVTWLGDHKLSIGDENPTKPAGDHSSTKNLSLRWTDLSMNSKYPQVADEEGEVGNKIIREVVAEKEHMFDKVVTPSDVGKLNRLVIPKQHAERFFPLDSPASGKGGLLLSFEDRTGKLWMFRYSYWNSSQSYVMTKGWSRFVKDKSLDAGDIVSFLRGVVDKDRLFIDWRHRPNARLEAPVSISYPGALPIPHGHSFSFHQPAPTGMGIVNYPINFRRDLHRVGLTAMAEVGRDPPRTNIYGSIINSALRDGSVFYQRPTAAAPAGRGGGTCGYGIEPPEVFEAEKVVRAPGKKQLRLFGVNMDCSMSESDESEIPDTSSSQYTQYRKLSMHSSMLQPNIEWVDKVRGPTSS